MTETTGIHPIGGIGVPHRGCYCRNCEAARPIIEMSDQTDTTERTALCDYLLSNEYRRLLIRAIASRVATTSAHSGEHAKALDLIEAAFPGALQNV